ncbi:MAG: hypothetical protein JO061_17690 [Acidobacteriaceae bacterium]|nr:hypothetical protein [Acidobacteriaceae bacterium]
MTRTLLLCVTILFAALSASAQDASDVVIPIPQQPFARAVPDFVGAPAVPNPIHAEAIPEDPFMAPNGESGVHLDAYQSDTYTIPGPLGHSPEVTSTFLAALCGTVTFDAQRRIVVVCVNVRPVLYLLDPVSLAILTRFPLPFAQSNGEFGAGGYFFLDNKDRAVIPTRTNDIWRIKEVNGSSGTTFVTDHTCSENLPSAIPSGEEILSTFPDAHGLLWFTTSGVSGSLNAHPAMVGTANPDPTDMNACAIKLYTLPSGEAIHKSFAVDPDRSRGGVFIVSDHQLYRFDAAPDGTPAVTWHEAYDRGTETKPGQRNQGSGTTPTLMGTKFVTIADNAEPRMNVNVYLRAPTVNRPRLVCSEPVFQPGTSDTFNLLIATGRSISVENNYGYTGPQDTIFGGTTTPGVTRIDLGGDGDSCHTVWNNDQESAPNVVSQMSLATGLEYTYTKDPSPSDAPQTDPWYFTAIDFHTGQTIYKVLAGTGVLYNSNYSSVYVGPDGKTAYVGVLGGLVRIHDTY